MPPDPPLTKISNSIGWQRLAVLLWGLLIAVVCVRSAVQQRTHSLYQTYMTAGSRWLAGTSLYYWGETEPGLEPYRYSPLVAVLLVPFHALPTGIGNVMWRLLNAGVLLGGLAAWMKMPLPWQPDFRQQMLLLLLVLPLSMTSLNNGQTNPIMVGLLLSAVAAAGHGRQALAAAFMALAVALKIYPLALGLLLVAAYPRQFAGWFLLALAVVAVLPFLFQRPGYVMGQYAEWLRILSEDDRKFWPLHMVYRDLWLLFRVTGASISPRAYQVIQVLSGTACAAICVAGRLRGWSTPQVLTTAFMLGTCWMTLCGPATESSTYILLAPALAWGMLTSRVERWPVLVRWLPDLAAGLLLVSILAGLSPRARDFHGLGLQPLAALLLFAAYLAVYLQALWHSSVLQDNMSIEVPEAQAA